MLKHLYSVTSVCRVSELENSGADTRSRYSTKKVYKFIFIRELGKRLPLEGTKKKKKKKRAFRAQSGREDRVTIITPMSFITWCPGCTGPRGEGGLGRDALQATSTYCFKVPFHLSNIPGQEKRHGEGWPIKSSLVCPCGFAADFLLSP